MTEKTIFNEKTIPIISVVLLSLIIIIVGSFHLSGRKVETEAKKIEIDSGKVKPQFVEASPLEKLWKEYSISIPLDPLKKPLKKYDIKKTPIRLNNKNNTFSDGNIKLKLSVLEKSHRMGQEDRFLVKLIIKNKTDKWMAYRVITDKSSVFVNCHNYRIKKINGFLLEPGESVKRFEGCSFSSKSYINLKIIQYMLIPQAGYINLFRLGTILGLDRRLEKSHQLRVKTKLPLCTVFTNKDELNKKIAKNPLAWFEIIEFYAKHDCLKEKLQ